MACAAALLPVPAPSCCALKLPPLGGAGEPGPPSYGRGRCPGRGGGRRGRFWQPHTRGPRDGGSGEGMGDRAERSFRDDGAATGCVRACGLG